MKLLKHIHTFILILFISSLAASCNPKITSSIQKNYDSLEFDQVVNVYGLDERIPENMEQIGQLKIRDTGFTTNCSYKNIINEAQLEARKVGGNAIKLTYHKKPNLWSTCHRVDAIILKTKK